MDPGLWSLDRVEELQRMGQCEIGLGANEEIPPRKRAGIGNENGPGIRLESLSHILLVVEKAQMICPRRIERTDATNLEITVTDRLGPEAGSEVGQPNGVTHWAVLNRRITSSVMSTLSFAYTRPDWNLLNMRVIPRSSPI
jgi:hypothetical protein